MPVLKNTRHERFAQNKAKGMSIGPAYTAAGYKAKDHSAEVNGARLLKNAEVQNRIAELMAPAVEATQATVERVLKEMVRLAFYDMTAILDSTNGRIAMKDPRELPEDLRRAILQAGSGRRRASLRVQVRRQAEGARFAGALPADVQGHAGRRERIPRRERDG